MFQNTDTAPIHPGEAILGWNKRFWEKKRNGERPKYKVIGNVAQ